MRTFGCAPCKRVRIFEETSELFQDAHSRTKLHTFERRAHLRRPFANPKSKIQYLTSNIRPSRSYFRAQPMDRPRKGNGSADFRRFRIQKICVNLRNLRTTLFPNGLARAGLTDDLSPGSLKRGAGAEQCVVRGRTAPAPGGIHQKQKSRASIQARLRISEIYSESLYRIDHYRIDRDLALLCPKRSPQFKIKIFEQVARTADSQNWRRKRRSFS